MISPSRAVRLDDIAAEEIGRELDALQDEVKASLGERDRRYILRMIRLQRGLALGARLAILGSLALLPRWSFAPATYTAFAIVIGLGTFALGVAKILENMEIGHNVLHGQWDWMHDPEISSATWEWDTVCPADQWKHSHNYVHHTWTNVLGKDRDIGYDVLRVSDRQPWHPSCLFQPIYNLLLALLFEWGVALHDIDLRALRSGKLPLRDALPLLRGIRRKVGRQVMKDYVLWPLLAGPLFFWVLGANAVANLIRNVWAYAIIFCGHFPDGAQVFTEAEVEGETRGRWYARQILGSCNIEGGSLFHVMSGNLSHQIEHHLFPDVPSNRYPEISPRVRAICARYGVSYNTGSFARQIGTTTRTILRLSLPAWRRPMKTVLT